MPATQLQIPQFDSLEQADEHRLALLEEIQDIEQQLAARAAATKQFKRPPAQFAEYQEWRSRAIAARFHKVNEMRDVKEWMRQQRDATMSGGDRLQEIRVLLRDAIRLLDELEKEFEPEEITE